MSHPINPAYLAAGKQAADQMMHTAFGRGVEAIPGVPKPLVSDRDTDQPADYDDSPCSHSACVPEVITLQPGQRALLVYKRALSQAEAHAIKQRPTERYPDNEISIADSVDSVLVLPPKDS